METFLGNNVYNLDIIFMQKLSTPKLAAKFFFLRNLQIFLGDGDIRGFSYDYFSLIFFLDACPVLEDFVLCVSNFFL
jgi:hypothetical protein